MAQMKKGANKLDINKIKKLAEAGKTLEEIVKIVRINKEAVANFMPAVEPVTEDDDEE